MTNMTLQPHSMEAEEIVLGAAMLNGAVVDKWKDGLHAKDFYIVKHQWVWEAIQIIARRGVAVDAVLVGMELERTPADARYPEQGSRLSQCDMVSMVGMQWLHSLTFQVLDQPIYMNADGHVVDGFVAVVKEMAERRAMLSAASEIARVAYDKAMPIEDVRGQVLKVSGDSIRASGRGGPRKQVEVVHDVIKRMEGIQDGSIDVMGLRTGLNDLDNLSLGMQRGETVFLAARPGVGKSALAACIDDNVSQVKGKVLEFSLEMSDEGWVGRKLASNAGVDSTRILRMPKDLRDDQWGNIYKAAARLDVACWIDDTPGLTLDDIRTRCRRLNAEVGLDLITIDLLTLIRAARRFDRHDLFVRDLAYGLHDLGKELNVALLVLAQLNRNVEQRADKRPLLSDLRESGAIEEAADQAWFIYRDEVYNPDTEMKNIAEVSVQKNRYGWTGKCNLFFDKTMQRFTSLVREKIAL